jgi:hypothetical protein
MASDIARGIGRSQELKLGLLISQMISGRRGWMVHTHNGTKVVRMRKESNFDGRTGFWRGWGRSFLRTIILGSRAFSLLLSFALSSRYYLGRHFQGMPAEV